MTRHALVLFLLLVVESAVGPDFSRATEAAAQQIPPAGSSTSQQQRFGTRTEAVVVDVSVTDRKGQPVTTLAQSDFEIYEDGVLQKILLLDRHAPNPNATAADAAGALGLLDPHRRAATSAQGPSVVALAFDRLSPEGRMLAYRAAERFVQQKQADELAGVFIVDQALRTLAGYTTDAAVLTAAVKQAAETATTQLARERTMLDKYTAPVETPVVASAEENGRAAGDLPWTDPLANVTDYAQRAVLEMMLRMERSYSDMLYEVQGRASIDALLALIDSMGAVPGRKAVIYFCEGLTIPPSVEPRFRSVIHTANRSNVTVYTVDAAGLRVHSKQDETARAVEQYGAMGVGDVQRRGKYLDALEDNERTLKQDPAVSLSILADQTGGFLVNNTNDLAKGIERIDNDRRHYYLLSYSSTNPVLDGKFHRITVKVKKRGMNVRARSGYLAAPMSDVGPVFDYELPALDALVQPSPPAEFPFQVLPANVPARGHPGRAVITVAVPGQSFTLFQDRQANTFAGGAVVVVRVVNDAGIAVRKFSEQFKLRGTLTDVAATQARALTFMRVPELEPGSYRIDAVVYDSVGERASVSSAPLTIYPAATPAIGDLLIIDHAEKIEPDQANGNPLVVGGLLLKPVLAPTIRRSSRTDINFAVPLALDPGQIAPPAKLGLVVNGQVVSTIALDLGPADANGRLFAVGRIPLSDVPPGSYQLQITIGAGSNARTRTTRLTVVE